MFSVHNLILPREIVDEALGKSPFLEDQFGDRSCFSSSLHWLGINCQCHTMHLKHPVIVILVLSTEILVRRFAPEIVRDRNHVQR